MIGPRLAKMSALGIVLLAVCVLSLLPRTAGTARTPPLPVSAKPGNLAIILTVDSPDGAISAREPLVVNVIYKNQGDGSVSVGEAGLLSTHVEVLSNAGKVLAESHRPRFPMDLLSSGFTLRLGEARSKPLVISALYQFRKPGEYLVRFQQLRLDEKGDVIAEGQVAFRVLPFDAKRLDARCNELWKMGPKNYNLKALYATRSDVALPYLELMARQWASHEAIAAMRRIGTERANKLVKSLAARNDEVGAAARKVLSRPPESNDLYWSMGGY